MYAVYPANNICTAKYGPLLPDLNVANENSFFVKRRMKFEDISVLVRRVRLTRF